VKVEVTHDVQKRELVSNYRRLSNPQCSDAGRLQVIRDSLTYARSIAGGAASDIRNHPTSSEWNTYFGGNNLNDIWYRFDIIAGDLASSGTRVYVATFGAWLSSFKFPDLLLAVSAALIRQGSAVETAV
jgi:hypothetical protein